MDLGTEFRRSNIILTEVRQGCHDHRTRVDNVQGPPILPEMSSKKEVGGASNIFCPGDTKHLVTPLKSGGAYHHEVMVR